MKGLKSHLMMTAFASLTLTTYGQAKRSIPFTANYKETSISTSGANPVQVTREGWKARSALGSTLEKEYAPGTHILLKERFFDANSRVMYSIDITNKTALGRTADPTSLTPPSDQPLGYETLDNVATTIYPVHNPQSHAVAGKIWVINGTDIIAQTVVEVPGIGTYRYLLSNIDVGREADAGTFQIPQGFEISRPVK